MSKVILITGASSGIGKVTARQLINEGYIVYATARRLEEMEDLKAMGGHVLPMDVTKEEDIVQTVSTVMACSGRIDVLWNNAGYGLFGAVEDISLTEAHRQLEVNLFGLAAVTKAVIPYMRQAGKGLIINTSSIAGKVYFPLGAWYHATKHAIEGFSDCMRLELKASGIDVVVLEPGFIATDFGKVMVENFENQPPNSVHADLRRLIIAQAQKMKPGGMCSPPEVIAQTVSKIIRSRHPKPRYRSGKFSDILIILRKFFGDRIYDWLIHTYLRNNRSD